MSRLDARFAASGNLALQTLEFCALGAAVTIAAMPARLSIVAALPKLKHLTRDEAARRLGITLAELAQRMAKVVVMDMASLCSCCR
jgi:hypothetical protein